MKIKKIVKKDKKEDIKKNVKKGLFVFTIYLIAAVFVFAATDRVEKLEESYKENNIALNFNK